jgi:hypothetical protein
MELKIAELLSRIKPDPWRQSNGFSPEIEEAHQRLFDSPPSDCEAILNKWLAMNQPCLFGRAAAKLGLIKFCILSEADLNEPDDSIRDKIQKSRTEWTREGFVGQKSAFVILANSPRIAYGLPDENVRELAKRLCSLYLLDEIEEDEIYLDELFLEKPGLIDTTWKWKAGVNYFSAQGDRRWWHDHRMPGGLGFSINSVGHMVKAAKLVEAMKEVDKAMEVPSEAWKASQIDTLEKALLLAMRTIGNAAETISGKATQLLPLPDERSSLPVSECPFKLPGDLAQKNFCEYLGYYHTDVTIPSEYFRDEIERPASTRPVALDFTYLFQSHVNNPAHTTMGKGQRIRSLEEELGPSAVKKFEKSAEESVNVIDCRRLQEVLKGAS